MMWRRDRPLVLGHRGASAHAPDNTLEAFQLALDDGADGVELDVRRTADDEMVVFHDPLIDGAAIVATRFSDLRESRPDVPTLAEALDVLSEAVVNIEIKNFPHEPDFDPAHRLAADVVALVHDLDIADRMLISSFNPDTVDQVRRVDPDLALGQLLLSDDAAEVARAVERGLQAVHPPVAGVTTELLRAAHAANMQVVVWTVNSPDLARSLAAAGVAAIISDDPALVLPG